MVDTILLSHPEAEQSARTLTPEIGRVNYRRLRNGHLGGQPVHHPGEDALVAPLLPAIVECLPRAILLLRITLPQAITINEDKATQNPSVINTRLAVALRKEGFQTRHLPAGQSEKVAHRLVSSRRLNHAATLRSLDPDPRRIASIAQPPEHHLRVDRVVPRNRHSRLNADRPLLLIRPNPLHPANQNLP